MTLPPPSHPIRRNSPPTLLVHFQPPSFLVHSSLSNPLEGSSWEGGKSRFDWIFGTSKEKGAFFLGARYCYFLNNGANLPSVQSYYYFFPLYKTGKYNVCSIPVPHKRGRESLQMRGKASPPFSASLSSRSPPFPHFQKVGEGNKKGGKERNKKVLKYKGKWRAGTEKKLKGASCEAAVLENPFKKRINKRTKIRRVRRGGEDTIFRLSDCNSSFTASPLILLQKEKYILLSSISVYRSERERETADGGGPFFCRHHFFMSLLSPPFLFRGRRCCVGRAEKALFVFALLF